MKKILHAAAVVTLLLTMTACDSRVSTPDHSPVTQAETTNPSSATPSHEAEAGRGEFGESEEKNVVDMTLFDNVVAAVAEGEINHDWSLFQTEVEQLGYTPSLTEGQFTIADSTNSDSYIYGDLSDESIAFIGYHLLSGNADRRVEIRFSDDAPQYYFEITPFFSGNRADNLDAIRSWLEYGYNGD